MKHKMILLFLVSIAVTSCKKTPLVATPASFSHTDLASCRNVECPEIQVDYLVYSQRAQVADSINKHIKDFIVETLYLGDPIENPQANTTDQAAQHFIDMYWTHNAEFPGLAIDYYAEILVTEQLKSKDMLSLFLRRYMFTGGAHGYGSVRYLNFDAQTGDTLTTAQLFTDIEQVTSIAETFLRKQYAIPKEAGINSTRFWFENEIFHLPETIGFTPTNVIFHYNQYEVASYADGPIILEIPIQQLQDFMIFDSTEVY